MQRGWVKVVAIVLALLMAISGLGVGIVAFIN
jgi:hypothetical protein